jgi:membrane-associated HD superfamily phosphohydrolase
LKISLSSFFQPFKSVSFSKSVSAPISEKSFLFHTKKTVILEALFSNIILFLESLFGLTSNIQLVDFLDLNRFLILFTTFILIFFTVFQSDAINFTICEDLPSI